jgi:hypothetical protein
MTLADRFDGLARSAAEKPVTRRSALKLTGAAVLALAGLGAGAKPSVDGSFFGLDDAEAKVMPPCGTGCQACEAAATVGCSAKLIYKITKCAPECAAAETGLGLALCAVCLGEAAKDDAECLQTGFQELCPGACPLGTVECKPTLGLQKECCQAGEGCGSFGCKVCAGCTNWYGVCQCDTAHGEQCCGGSCCQAGQWCCPDGCTYLSGDPRNCGICGNVCAGATLVCIEGSCVPCETGYATCRLGSAGVCCPPTTNCAQAFDAGGGAHVWCCPAGQGGCVHCDTETPPVCSYDCCPI